MKVHEVKSAEDTVRFIVGTLNDFEGGHVTKEEAADMIADLVIHIACRASDATKKELHQQ